MSLPSDWVKRIFEKMSLVYGRDFIDRWEGQPLGNVMDDWAHELDALGQNPSAIRYGLENLPPAKAPTVLEFRALCNRRPDPPAPQLPAPPANQAVVARALSAMQAARPVVSQNKAAALLDGLRARRAAGTLTSGQADFLARAEAGIPAAQVGDIGDFKAIPPELLPPGMKAAAP